jgi:DNA primase
MGIKEQTLLNSMNGMIAKDLEEKEKERARAAGNETTTEQVSQPLQPIGLHSADEQTLEVEKMLIKSVIKDGEKIIFDQVETEDGGTTSLTVAQYIAYDLGQDGLTFHNDLYNQILQEAVEHSGEADFKAENYFMQHPDVNITSLAANLAIDRHQLGKGFQVKEREGGLKQHVLHLVLDLRLDIVEKRLKEIQAQLKQAGSDMMRIRELLEEYKDTQLLRDALARQLGNDIVI